MGEKHTCCKIIYSGSFSQYAKPCGKTAKFERDGKHYCGTHDPVSRRARDDAKSAERKARWDAENQRSRAASAAAAEQNRRADCYDDLLAALQHIRPYLNAGEALLADAAISKATGVTP